MPPLLCSWDENRRGDRLQGSVLSVQEQVVVLRRVVGNKGIKADLLGGVHVGIGGIDEFRKTHGVGQCQAEVGGNLQEGDDVVDIVGYDKYNAVDGLPNLSSISSTFYSLVQSTDGEKMVAMTENDSIPSLENLLKDKASWLYFCPWYMNYLTSEQNNPVENLIEIYQSDYCITLDELPDLKTYPLSDEQPSTGDEEIITGDVNLDGNVKSDDAVLLSKFLTGKESLKTVQLKKADVYEDESINVFDLIALKRILIE